MGQRLLLAQQNNKNADIRRGDAADAAGLANIGRADFAKLFDGFQPQATLDGIVKVFRDGHFFQAPHFPHLGFLLFEVALVLQLNLGLFGSMRMDRRPFGIERGKGRIADLRAAEQFRGADRLTKRGAADLFQILVQFRGRCDG